MRHILILFSIALLISTTTYAEIQWLWVGENNTAETHPEDNYDKNSGYPLTITNINHLLDENLLEDFYGMVPENQQVDPALLNSSFENISIKESYENPDGVTVKVTFLNEGAGYRNSLGYFIYDTNNPPNSISDVQHILIFPNSSKSGSGGSLIQGDQVDLHIELTAGQSIGFFVNSNGWNGYYGYQKTGFLYGQPFYTLTSLNPTVGLGPRYHVILNDSRSGGETDTGYFAYGFEDILTTGGDRDYNDVIFNVEITPISAVVGIQDAIVIQSVNDQVTTKTGVLAFEDNWPLAGDYDFNDAVLAYNIKKIDNGDLNNEYVRTLELRYEIKAIGATFHNGIAVSIPGLVESMINSVKLEKTKNGSTITITENTQVDAKISTGTDSKIISYNYPLIKDRELANNHVSFTLSEDLFEELSTFDTSEFVYSSRGCLYKTASVSGCVEDTSSSTLKLTIVLKPYALAVSSVGDMPFDTYLFGSDKNDIYRYSRGKGADTDWFSSWSENYSGRDSAKGPGPGKSLEIHLKGFSGTNAFENDFSTDNYDNAIEVDAQNDSNGKNRFISRQVNINGVETGNLPWVLDLPAGWKHPKERVDISHAYPNFVKWVKDNDSNTDWYETDVNHEKLYSQ